MNCLRRFARLGLCGANPWQRQGKERLRWGLEFGPGRIARALATLDLVIFVPVQRPDEIAVPIEYPQLRAKVDRRLKTMLRQDDLGLLDEGRPRIAEISGSHMHRLARIASMLG